MSTPPPVEQNQPPADDETLIVVGLGASAGGLHALETFFSHVSPGGRVAYLVVTHTSAARVSRLSEILGRQTALPVIEVAEAMTLAPGGIYVATSGCGLRVEDGRIAPEPVGDKPDRLPINLFFKSLAQAYGDRAVGIVLSGTGSDGTLGLKDLHAAGGLVMAQQEDTAGHGGMPRSAINGIDLDYVLPPEEMSRVITAYVSGMSPARERGDGEGPSDETLRKLFGLLRRRTGHDFINYKLSTVRRRIARRLSLHQLENPRDYLRLVQSDPAELDKLLKELLINVTAFFRDREAFDVLQHQVLPRLLEETVDRPIRVWVAGCASGEEAYSLAILIREYLDANGKQNPIQIFATDLDEGTVEQARLGVFREAIEHDVGPERLQRFFNHEDGCYRIKKEIRDCLVFAKQNLISDPPFTNLDLLSCRNLLIYLDGTIQKRLLPLFHYTLRPGGVLFLGSSESVGNSFGLFHCIDKRWKIFERREVPDAPPLPPLSQLLTRDTPLGRGSSLTPGARRPAELNLSQIAERALVAHLLPPTVIIHERGEVVHIHGRTGQFLEPAPGPQTQVNLFSMLREGLHLELTVAMRQAAASPGDEVVHRKVRVQGSGGALSVTLRVRQLLRPEQLKGLYLVSFDVQGNLEADAPQRPELDNGADENTAATRDWVRHLEREVQSVRDVHQSTVEELETANEELRSTNEELQSANEELQSANEELETSKEEMQSLNEELYTVNAELQSKVEELSRANDDMKNLLNGTDIAMLFLDNSLKIKRFTLETTRIIRVIATDIGRPISDLVSRLSYDRLVDDAEQVMRTLVFREAEVQSQEGRWYLMRILPYRTADNVIDGLVLTFVDITAVKVQQPRKGAGV